MESFNATFSFAVPHDASDIARLRQKVWADTYRGVFPDDMIDQFDFAWHTQQDRDRILRPDFRVYRICVSEGNSIGYLVVRLSDPILLHSLYLIPEFQHQGIGHQAFQQIYRLCREEGADHFICHCHPENQNAIRFYEGLGGVLIEKDMSYADRWQNSLVYQFSVPSL